jgi:hypothetical protein
MLNTVEGMNYLQKIYKLGIIDYPRVDNDYHKDNFYQLLPHPKLFEFGNKFTPIKEEKLSVKDNPLLYLNHLKIVSPANVINFSRVFFLYFNRSIEFKPKKKEEYEKIVDTYNFLEKKNPEYTFSSFGKWYKSLFDNSLRTKKRLYYFENAEFINNNLVINRLKKFANLIRKKNETFITIERAKSLSEIIKKERVMKQKKLSAKRIKNG